MNHNILVEAKKEYTNQLQQILKPRIYEGLKSMYEDTISMIGREYIENGGQNGSVIKAFQKVLRDIPMWNQEMINREFERIMSSSKCDYFEDLIETVFITNIKILSSVQINGTQPIGLSVNIPSSSHFIHKCYIECAKEIYKNPYVFENSKSLTPKERHNNMRDALNYIENSVNAAIRDLLPIRDILKHNIVKQNGGSSGNGVEISQENVNTKQVEISLKPSEQSEVSNQSGGSLSEDDDESEGEDNDDESEGEDDDESEGEDDDDESEGDESNHNDVTEESESVIQTGGNIQTDEVNIMKEPLNIQTNIEIPSENINQTLVVQNNSNEMNITPDKPETSTSNGGFHLFDKLSKVFNPNQTDAVKQVDLQTSQQSIPLYNNVKPIVENRPPEIKEIFIGGKQSSNHFGGGHLLKKRPTSDMPKQKSLYEKKYDEYIRNSEIKSSSIRPSISVSRSVSKQPSTSKQSISGISTSKTIILEDASEYVSDNVDF